MLIETTTMSPKFKVFRVVSADVGSWQQTTRITGKSRIAFVVHGVESNRVSMQPLAAYLLTKPYSEVLVVEYDSINTPLATTAATIVAWINEAATGPVTIDIFGHSLGVAISRYAIERVVFGSRVVVGKFFSLAGLNWGEPVQVVTAIVQIASQYDCANNPSNNSPAIADATGDATNSPDQPFNAFWTELNGNRSKVYNTIPYYLLSGNQPGSMRVNSDDPRFDGQEVVYASTLGKNVELAFPPVPLNQFPRTDGLLSISQTTGISPYPVIPADLIRRVATTRITRVTLVNDHLHLVGIDSFYGPTTATCLTGTSLGISPTVVPLPEDTRNVLDAWIAE